MPTMLGNNIIQQVIDNPDVAERFDWRKADGNEWIKVLCAHPRLSYLADRYEWCFVKEWAGRDFSRNWTTLICADSQFAEKCDVNKLEDEDIAVILKKWSNLANRINVNSHGGNVAAWVVNALPNEISNCRFKNFGSCDWRDFILESIDRRITNQALANCDWDKVHDDDLVEILKFKPEYKQYVTKARWRNFSDECWRALLNVNPGFRAEFDLYTPFQYEELHI